MAKGKPHEFLEFSKRVIPLKLSFNHIKLIGYHLQHHQMSSPEGEIIRILMKALESHLLRQIAKGNMSKELLEQLNISYTNETKQEGMENDED